MEVVLTVVDTIVAQHTMVEVFTVVLVEAFPVVHVEVSPEEDSVEAEALSVVAVLQEVFSL